MNTKLQRMLDAYRDKIDCPGMMMGVEAGTVRWYGTTGIFTPADLETPFYVYGVTKTFIATCILRLVEVGQRQLAN